jgi:hypothetical protein
MMMRSYNGRVNDSMMTLFSYGKNLSERRGSYSPYYQPPRGSPGVRWESIMRSATHVSLCQRTITPECPVSVPLTCHPLLCQPYGIVSLGLV